ncbi:MAG: HI0933-like protein [Chloroflexi bacterium ADurb.Bin360]|nr:MAG: HI0933-like protein [Chloroflexi bacterium ADurb.Bin360]
MHTIRAEERDGLAALLKDFRWRLTGALPLAAGMVTAGGIALKEVDPISFASRLIAGLYLAGEVLDLAADTGGYNLQAAFSTGYLAGAAAAK